MSVEVLRGGRGLSRRSRVLIAVTAFLAAAEAATVWAAIEQRPLLNLLAGALLALVLITSSYVASEAAAGNSLRQMKVSFLGSLGRMTLAGATIFVVGTRGWFQPLPFVGAFGAVYFTLGVWLVLAQRGKVLSAAGDAP